MFLAIIFICGGVYASNYDELRVVDPQKMWTITFNDYVDFSSNIDKLILVRDDMAHKVDTSLALGNNGKSILVFPPNKGYGLGKIYSLYIDKNVQSSKGSTLKDTITMDFKVKNNQSDLQVYNFENSRNLSIKDYLNILNGSLEIRDEQVILAMYLRNLPDKLLFNKPEVKDFAREHCWGVAIGTNHSKGYVISASNFKFPGANQISLPIEMAVQKDVWALEKHPTELSGSSSSLSKQGIEVTLHIDYDLNLIQINGTIPGLPQEKIDYIEVFADEYRAPGDKLIIIQ
jgi:hypothetical protein